MSPFGGRRGKTVKFRRGPAAVTGDAFHNRPLAEMTGWEGVRRQMIRKPEDLPELEYLC